MTLPAAFLQQARLLVPEQRRFEDPLSTLAFGTDASFYRLIPKLVVRVESEDEVVALLKLAQSQKVPVTFRAAGTSLSGQAISDSVLIVLGDNWNGREIRGQGTQIRLQPGVIGAQANAWLAPFGRKIGPDPASINACKIGGIVANNASGMCCGTAQNTYHTLAGIRHLAWDTGWGYDIARQFGLPVVPTRPALVPLTFDATQWAPFAELSGLSLPVEIATGSKKDGAQFHEDLLFTHRGLSGPAATVGTTTL